MTVVRLMVHLVTMSKMLMSKIKITLNFLSTYHLSVCSVFLVEFSLLSLDRIRDTIFSINHELLPM